MRIFISFFPQKRKGKPHGNPYKTTYKKARKKADGVRSRGSFFRLFSANCTLLGGVVGAGFLSGRELVRFFGGAPLLGVFIAAIGFFALSFLFLSLGKRQQSVETFSTAAFGRAEPLFSYAVLLSDAAVCTALFSSVDEIARQTLGVPVGVVSACAALACYLIAHRGLGALNAACRWLVPLPTLLFVAMLFIFSPSAPCLLPPSAPSFASIFLPVLYVGMNLFLSLPVLLEEGFRAAPSVALNAAPNTVGKVGTLSASQKGKGSLKKCTAGYCFMLSATFSVVLSALILLVLAALSATPSLLSFPLPLYTYFSANATAKNLYAVLLLCAVVTSLLGVYYPVSRYVQSLPHARVAEGFLLVALLLISRFGVSAIVDRAYPVIGGVGLAFSLFASFRLRKKSTFRLRKKSENSLQTKAAPPKRAARQAQSKYFSKSGKLVVFHKGS